MLTLGFHQNCACCDRFDTIGHVFLVEAVDLCFDFLNQKLVCFDRLDQILVSFEIFRPNFGRFRLSGPNSRPLCYRAKLACLIKSKQRSSTSNGIRPFRSN